MRAVIEPKAGDGATDEGVDDLEGFTIKEVADRLRVHPNTVREWIIDGSLHAVRRGEKFVRVRPSQLRDFLDAHSH